MHSFLIFRWFLAVADWRCTMWASFVPIVEREEEEEEQA
jgi:hypothetical protein